MKILTSPASWLQTLTPPALVLAALIGTSRLPVFHDTEGFLTVDFCLLLSLATALLLAGMNWRSPMRTAAIWFALFIFGQGLVLQLIDAGTAIHYQHSHLVHGINTTREAILVSLLVLQSLAVIVGMSGKVSHVTAWISTHLGKSRAVIIFLLVLFLSVFPSRELHHYAYELVITGFIVAVQLACLLLGLMAIPADTAERWNTRLNNFIGGTGEARSIDRLAFMCALWTSCIAIALAVLSYERHPHIADEVAYIFQANYFAQGLLGTPPPPVPEAVESYLIDCDSGPCFSPVPPGWPAVLALGALAGADWLVNPLLSGINILLLFMLLQRLYDRYTARLGVLLAAASPWYLLMSMNFMTHTFSLTCTLVAALSVLQMRHRQNSLWGIPGGIAIGLLSLTRPLEGVMVALVLGLAALFGPGRRIRLAPVFVLGLASMITGSAVLPYNKALTGDPLTFPIMAYADKALGPGVNSLGFGPDKGITWGGLDPFPGHGLPDVLVNAGLNLSAMNIEMFGWSIGSLLPILLFLALRSTRRIAPADGWMLFSILVIFAFQSLYWFSGGPDFAARYYYLIVIPLVALTVQALKGLGQTVACGATSPSRVPATILIGVMILSTGALANFLPWRAIDKYHHYRDMRPDIRNLVSDQAAGADLLLIKGEDHPDQNSAIVYTSIDPYGDGPIIALDKNPEVRRQLLNAYPDRSVWLIDGPSLTGSGYRVTAGPVNAAELIN